MNYKLSILAVFLAIRVILPFAFSDFVNSLNGHTVSDCIHKKGNERQSREKDPCCCTHSNTVNMAVLAIILNESPLQFFPPTRNIKYIAVYDFFISKYEKCIWQPPQ
jgi:hypothetical protein